MEAEQVFRVVFILVFVGALFISGYFRRRARQSGEVISRASEGKAALLARLLGAVVLFSPFFAYMLNPKWAAWSSLALPLWLRWLGVAVGVGTLPALYWVMVAIGKNVSETVLTKQGHELVTHGPYRWVRHPLYTVATVMFFSLGVMAASWYMMGMALTAFPAIAALVVPREEAELARKFGSEYPEYQERTGRFVPRTP